jgi:hypothetical protein
MAWGFRNGSSEAIRLAKQYAEANGMLGLRCVDAQPYDQPPGTIREKGVINWTVRFDGLPPSPYDDGSVIFLVFLQTGEVRRLGSVRLA